MSDITTATELLEKLVAFDTTSAKSNLKLIAFVEDYLRQHGVVSTRVPTEDGTKAGLFATIGPEGHGGVALSAHTDCVPVTGQSWSSDPFTLTARDGKLYGRGSCDMKGFLACVLALVPSFVAAELAEPIHLALSYDEEVGCVGVRPMLDLFGKELPMPRAAIIGEPTKMSVVDAHKQIDIYAVTVNGLAGHSSEPDKGVNAIRYAAELIVELQRLGAEAARTHHDDRFSPAYTTAEAGTIEGGTATNIIPKTCRFEWLMRSLPMEGAARIPDELMAFAERELLPKMHAVSEETGIEMTQEEHVPGFQAPPGSDAVALALSLTGRNSTGAVSFTTEAGLFEKTGCPAVVCGPGDIAQAHAPDEFVSVSELEACMGFLGRLQDRVSR
ncbi:Acetylornithine deacetylase [Methyloligella halotolerans]|uniref:Acetylornithine deacetylase n=1 Tax=Methyloligella halotolerans TaxID=1177755 RepID=A0A1E2RYC2_9HYPH|nr:acetylornithine deacetylase [Methyloligella halotolerans]ODA67049.1 Acetylornithine deacetylase [Methyloligella halotolerans]